MSKLTYWFGCQGDGDTLAVTAVVDALDEQDLAHTVLLRRVGNVWSTLALNSRSIGVLMPQQRPGVAIVPCFDGSVCFVQGQSQHWEVVFRGAEGPSTLRRLTFSCIIDSHLYVVGMQRQVFRRHLNGGPWERFDEGCLVPSDSTQIAGFNAIAAVGAETFYAVGYGGEIWMREGALWSQCTSPTNMKLTGLCSGPDGVVYAVGGKGLLLKGCVDHWRIVDQSATTQGLVAVTAHLGQIYVCCEQGGLFVLDGELLKKVSLPANSAVHTLHSHGQRLLALGFRAAFMKDGDDAWQALSLPQLDSNGAQGESR
jgi:hypothetical protein